MPWRKGSASTRPPWPCGPEGGVGIGTYVYLLGTPAEDADAAERTLALTVRHSGLIDYLNWLPQPAGRLGGGGPPEDPPLLRGGPLAVRRFRAPVRLGGAGRCGSSWTSPMASLHCAHRETSSAVLHVQSRAVFLDFC